MGKGNRKSKQNWDSKRTFIVLDVPAPFARQITEIRSQFRSWRVALPVEITIAGSSGLGVLRYHESEIDGIFETIGDIASGFSPIVTKFVSFERFPNTRVVYLTLKDDSLFIALQNALVENGLRFERSPFPFTPHCTIVDADETADFPIEFASLITSETEIVLDTLSVYNLDERVLSGNPEGCRLMYRAKLGAEHNDVLI